ncbi:hypothetical protein LHS21_000125 [Salmonella enterica subsp. enterica serovar Newport]|nr:hypothetical protein [Salmonella enterica subsp. enterica serovar Newport]
MKLTYAITLIRPHSAKLDYQGVETGSSRLTAGDVIAAMGMVQARQAAGMAMITAKFTKDSNAAEIALNELIRYGCNVCCKYIGRVSGKNTFLAVRALAVFALEDYSRTADTPGAKCLCGGRGEIRDIKQSIKSGVPVTKTCPRCRGTGLKPISHTRCHQALVKYVQVSQPTYSRRWKPLYDALLSWCYQQQGAAEREFEEITRG